MQAPEIELKFPVADADTLQNALPALGFHLDTSRTFERNTLYDTAERSLRAQKQVLRLREYGAVWTVTHKRQPDPSESVGDSRYKVRIETETRIEDGFAMAEIFASLGYKPVFRYEKFRSEWSANAAKNEVESSGHLVIDETPIGIFAELEGPVQWIDEKLAALKIDPACCLTDSYGKLFLDWKERTGSSAQNLSFSEIPVTNT